MSITKIIVLEDDTVVVNFHGENTTFFQMDVQGNYMPTEKEKNGEHLTIDNWKESVDSTKSPILNMDHATIYILYEKALAQKKKFFDELSVKN